MYIAGIYFIIQDFKIFLGRGACPQTWICYHMLQSPPPDFFWCVTLSKSFFPFFSHFKRFINIFVEFIPQVLFLMSLFGWLVFLIFYKWCYHYEDPNTVSMPWLCVHHATSTSKNLAQEDYCMHCVCVNFRVKIQHPMFVVCIYSVHMLKFSRFHLPIPNPAKGKNSLIACSGKSSKKAEPVTCTCTVVGA